MTLSTKVIIIFSGLVLAILQTSFIPTLLGTEVNFNLVAIFTLILLFSGHEDLSYLFALMCGTFLDLISASLVGITSLLLCVLIIFYKYIANFYVRDMVSRYVFAFIMLYVLKLITSGVVIFSLPVVFSTALAALICTILKPRALKTDTFLSK